MDASENLIGKTIEFMSIQVLLSARSESRPHCRSTCSRAMLGHGKTASSLKMVTRVKAGVGASWEA